jgi:hypothetical protein
MRMGDGRSWIRIVSNGGICCDCFGLGVITAETVKSTFLRVVRPCRSELSSAYHLLLFVSCLVYSSILKMEAICLC